jgi:telomerase Cajal body protein 1
MDDATTVDASHQPLRLTLLAQAQAIDTATGEDSHASTQTDRSFFTSAQWAADGTSVITTSSAQTVSTFVLPDDLLDPSQDSQPPQLRPDSTQRLPEPAQVVTAAPYFSLAEPASQTYLAPCRDHPIQLRHAFPGSGPPVLCTYKLIKKETEQYITPSSLIWSSPGTHFVAGSTNRLDLFDVSRPGNDGPLLTLPTIPSRRHISKGGGVGMKGAVSALSASPADADGSSIIAAGTWTRWLGLYDFWRSDKTIANWSISGAGEGNVDVTGRGIAQTLWSPCGRYLVINERASTGLLVYDIRVTGQLLSVLFGRGGETTQQRLHCDVFAGEDGGFEVWAGSQDGMVHTWTGVGLHSEYGAAPCWSIRAHESPVGSTVLHQGGSVLATCSGGWEHSALKEDEDHNASQNGEVPRTTVLEESSLKLWTIENQSTT